MPGNSDVNGQILYFDKPPANQTIQVSQASTSSAEIISGLYACNIQTDIVGSSIKIQIGNMTYGHIELDGITSVDIIGTSLQLNNADQLPIILTFVDATETQNALGLLEDAMNGQYIDCADTILNVTLTLNSYLVDGTVSYPSLIFANDVPLGKANNQSDVINLLLVYGQFNYTVIQGVDSQHFVIYYQKPNEGFVPNTINCLNTFFTCGVNASTVSFTIDYLSSDKFWIWSNNILTVGTESPTITFINPSNNTFDLFYVNDYLTLLNLSNNQIVSITGQLPDELQNLSLLTTSLSECSFLSGLTELSVFNISNCSSSSIDFSTNESLVSITILDSTIQTITGTSGLLSLNSFLGRNLPITSTPDFSSAATNLKLIEFDGCYYITSLSTISSNTTLTSYIVNGSSLSSSSLDLTHNINLKTLVIANCNLMTFSSLISNVMINSIDVSNDDLLSTTVEQIVADLAGNIIVRNGTLTLSNQQTPIDYTTLGDPFNTNLDILRIGLSWTVNL